MEDIELSKDEIILICEILRTDIQASLSVLRIEKDVEHARFLAERIVKCNKLLGGLE